MTDFTAAKPVSTNDVNCVATGAMIKTERGEVPVESLCVGDLVQTRDNGFQPIRMVHSRTLSAEELAANRKFYPVRIKAGALGFGAPHSDLLVSQQHKILYSSIQIPLNFAEDAVLVRAQSLTASFENIFVDSSVTELTYYHLVFDQHEIVYANGTANESFFPSERAVAALSATEREELFGLFPTLPMGEKPKELDYLTVRSWEFLAAVA